MGETLSSSVVLCTLPPAVDAPLPEGALLPLPTTATWHAPVALPGLGRGGVSLGEAARWQDSNHYSREGVKCLESDSETAEIRG